MLINNYIFFHISICVFLIIVEYVLYYYKRFQKKKIQNQIKKYTYNLKIQIEYVGKFGTISNKYKHKLKMQLKNINNLVAFEKAYSGLNFLEKRHIVNSIMDIFKYLVKYYDKNKGEIEKAYLAYFIGEYFDFKAISFFVENLYTWLSSKSTYTRINSLNAIYKIGNKSHIIKTMNIINVKEYQYSAELLAYVLENIKKEKKLLAVELFNRFDLYNKNIQIAIIKFLANNNYIENSNILQKLKSNHIHVDVKCEILRYFQKNRDNEAKEYLLEILKQKEIVANDLNLKIIGTLGYYDEISVVEVLNLFVNSNDDLIKEAAYKSLEKMKQDVEVRYLELV